MNLSNILRIAKWEFSSKFVGIDAKTILLLILALVFIGGVGYFGGTPNTSQGLYTVGVDTSSEYYPVVEQSEKLYAVPPNSEKFADGKIDVLITEDGMTISGTKKGQAAMSALDTAIRKYNNKQLQNEPNQAKAFPVSVSVLYFEQTSVQQTQSGTSGTTTSGTQSQQTQNATSGTAGPTVEKVQESNSESKFTSPGDVSQPFPFEALIYAFIFLIPLNFIVQAFSSSIIEERSNEHGKLLLSAPISEYDIIFGKALPYLGASILAIVGITAVIGAGLLSILAVIPLAILYLSAGFVAAVFSRSYKELTFLMLAISVSIMAYAFIPSIFANINAISALSPLTVVIKEMESAAIPLSTLSFSTLPLLLVSGILFAYGGGLYKEEYLFTRHSFKSLFLAGLSERISSVKSPFIMTALALPLVFVAELGVLGIFIIVPELFSIPVLLVAIAFVEEIAKSIHLYAGFESKRFMPTIKIAAIVGAVSGFGFFVAEKASVVTQSIGLGNQSLGGVILGGGLTPNVAGTIGIFILLLWPFLHSITAVISALGARKGRNWYIVGLIIATIVHVGYNLTVVMAYAG